MNAGVSNVANVVPEPESRRMTVSLFAQVGTQPDPSVPVHLDPDADNPIEAAFLFLNHVGYDRASFFTAATGYSRDRRPQVLILGHSYIALLGPQGETLLEVGLREIRGLRWVEGTGLEVWITPISSSSEVRESPVVHVLRDRDARYLEVTWLKMSPTVHNGVQLNSVPWREEEYALFVGRVIMEAARCETALSTLLLQLKACGRDIKDSSVGSSGKELISALRDSCGHCPAINDVLERYEDWSSSRNYAAHGFRASDENGNPTSVVLKMKRKFQTSGDQFESIDQDYEDLALLWRAFYAITYDTHEIVRQLRAPGQLEELLAGLTMPNTVLPSERLPTQN